MFKRFLHQSTINMAKRNFKGKKFRGRGGQGKRDAEGSNTTGYEEITKENEKWETYYRDQKLMSEKDFASFKEHCKVPLPLTFRITGSKQHAEEIKKIFKDRHLKHLGDIKLNDQIIKPPKPIAFYPDQLAWQIDISKQEVRKNEQFAKTQRFLVIETEVGNISRQEAVSMIPPLVLDVQPHHKVLDMCAAPGSKTAQLIESLHQVENPTGFVVANDADFKRAHMLVHQIKRLNSPNMVVVNHDAQMFPKSKFHGEWMKFDRILCDVPCSGDGTIRKNVQIWKKWSIGDGIGLNPLQYRILQRGIEQLAEGGRLVYSTCSLNPMENEAVIAHALKNNKDIKIVKTKLPGLVHSKGLKTWKVYGKDFEVKEKGADEKYGDELFPPEEDLGLQHCIRVYPHQQNTGGFFIAVLEKVGGEAEEPATKKFKKDIEVVKKEKLSNTATEPFNFLAKDQEELVKCWDFYGINKDSSITESCFVRNATGEPSRGIYLSNPITKQYLYENEEKLKIVHSGVKLFVSQRTDLECKWRIQSEALQIIKSELSGSRILKCSLKLFEKLLKEGFPTFDDVAAVDKKFGEKIQTLSQGCAFIRVSRGKKLEELTYPIWVGGKCVNLMLSKKEVFEVLYRVFNIETSNTQEYKQTPKGPGKPIGDSTEVKDSTEEPVV